MQSVIAFACLLAVASAGYLNAGYVNAPLAYAAYAAYDDGAYRGEGLYESAYKGEGLVESQDYEGRIAVAAPLASEARLVDPVAIAAGAPLPTGDTVEVAAAKAAHLQAHAVAKGLVYSTPLVRNIGLTVAAPIAVARSTNAVAYNAPLVSAPHPIPVARSYIAHTYAAPYAHAYASPIAYGAHGLALASEARLVDPVAIAAGAPLPTGDTVEVAAAKASHLQAHAVAKGLAYSSPIVSNIAVARTSNAVAYNAPLVSAPHPIPVSHSYIAHTYAAPYAHAYASPIAYGAHGLALASEARLVDPVAIAAGAPLPTGDTVEVAAAKANHYAAHAAAKGHIISNAYGYGRLGNYYL